MRWPCLELEDDCKDGLQQIGHAWPEERNQRGYNVACSVLSRSTGVSNREIFNDTESRIMCEEFHAHWEISDS